MSAHTTSSLTPGTIPIVMPGTGKLINFHAVGIAETNTAVALTGIVGDARDALSAADARRLAACWNACQNIETEVLEQHALGVISAEHSQQIHKMLAALTQIANETRNIGSAHIIARGAIAKAEGRPAMSTQPDALRLADQLKARYGGTVPTSQAAAELRRQYAEIEFLHRRNDALRQLIAAAQAAGSQP